MADFYADTDQIRRAAVRAAALGAAASTAHQYAQKWTEVPVSGTGEIFKNFRGTAVEVSIAAEQALDHRRRVVVNTADELFRTADHYAATDHASAAQSDALLRAADAFRNGRPGGWHAV